MRCSQLSFFVVALTEAARVCRKIVLLYNSADDYMLPQLNVGNTGLQAVGGLTREAGLRVSCRRWPPFAAYRSQTLPLQLFSYYTDGKGMLKMSFPDGPMVAPESRIVGVDDNYSGGLIS